MTNGEKILDGGHGMAAVLASGATTAWAQEVPATPNCKQRIRRWKPKCSSRK